MNQVMKYCQKERIILKNIVKLMNKDRFFNPGLIDFETSKLEIFQTINFLLDLEIPEHNQLLAHGKQSVIEITQEN